MKRYIRLALLYVFIAASVVFLYAPWGLNLRPTDYNILRAGFSIIFGVALLGTFGAGTYLALRDPGQKLLEAGDVMSEDEVVPILREYSEAPYVGGIAGDALDQVRSASRKRSRLNKAIEAHFSKGSITWERYTGLVDQAHRTIVRNCALLANAVQTFDRVEYGKDLADARRYGNANTEAARVQREQVAVHNQALAHMHDVLDANERVLLELGKLELELGKLESGETLSNNSETIEELSQLISETQYYA